MKLKEADVIARILSFAMRNLEPGTLSKDGSFLRDKLRSRLKVGEVRAVQALLSELMRVTLNSVDSWQPIATAPKDRSIMLVVAGTVLPIYCGRLRHGNMGEPAQDQLAWRCDSSGRYAEPTHWQELPGKPK